MWAEAAPIGRTWSGHGWLDTLATSGVEATRKQMDVGVCGQVRMGILLFGKLPDSRREKPPQAQGCAAPGLRDPTSTNAVAARDAQLLSPQKQTRRVGGELRYGLP